MKIWNKVKYPLIIGLIVAVMSFLRFLMFAGPSWIDTGLYYPVIFIGFILGEIGAQIFMIALCAGAVMLVPCDWLWDKDQEKLRRFVIRPAIAVVIMLCLSGILIHCNDSWEDNYWDRQVDAYCQEISAFLDVADEVILHNSSTHNYTPYFDDERIRCECGTYHDVIMIDYDTMRVAFLHHGGISDFFVYELEPGALPSGNGLVQANILLDASQNRLITYTPGVNNGHRTSAIELILADGTAYSTTDTPDDHWDNAFLDLSSDTGDYIFQVGQPHPK